jgi:hypothetical protein
MAQPRSEELEALAQSRLKMEMAWIEEMFGNVRAQSSAPSTELLRVMRNLLIYRVTRITGFLDEHKIW